MACFLSIKVFQFFYLAFLCFQAQVCDWTGMHWISLFQEQAETLLEGTAEEIGSSRDADYPQGNYDAYFRKPLFKIYQFRVRAKMETFNVRFFYYWLVGRVQ